METLWQDLRYGIRMLLKKPGFTLVAIITLALGIGANTAIFSVVNAVLLRPLQYPEPERLFTTRSNFSFLNLQDFKSQSKMFESMGGVTLQALDFTGEGEPVQVNTALVTEDLFPVLGAKASIGRTILPEEARFGGERVVVLSHGFWKRHFGGDGNIIGKTIQLSGNEYTVIGVMPPDFNMPESNPEAWASLCVVNPLAAAYRGVHFLRTYWRLKPGVSLAQAQSEIDSLYQWLGQKYPEESQGRNFMLIPLQEKIVGNIRPALLVLFGAVCLVLLIACANFANLLLARAASRHQEVVIRAALGAGRWRLVRQMLTESILLSLLGGAAGLMIALWSIDLLVSLKPNNLPRLTDVGIDLRVLLFTIGVSFLTGIIFGLLPALNASRANVSEALRDGGRSSTLGTARHRLLNTLVVSELALALVLLIGSGLLVKGFLKLRSIDPGFNPENILTMRVELPEARYTEIPKQTQFRTRVLEALNSLPGVKAGMISEVPMSGEYLYHNTIIEGQPPVTPGQEPEIFSRTVSGDYFQLMSIPLQKGRLFDKQDREGMPLVCIVNDSLVREYFQNQDPIGKRIRWARMSKDQGEFTIVGVVGDVRHFGLDQPEQPSLYTPYEQLVQPWKRWMSIVVRGNGDPATLTGLVKGQIWSVDNQIPVTKIQTLKEMIGSSFDRQKFNMQLLTIFAIMALLLAAVGIYGVISYSVTQRTHEIGIRMALGAQQGDVMKMILKQGLLMALIGISIGVAGALALTHLMSSLLFGISATDPVTFAEISILLASVTLIASYLPARRAMKVDPMVALRYE